MEPLVSICCITYNHELYIRDAIEGFLRQKTTFPVEIIIHDDASTDNTAVIVREYAEKHPDLIVAILQKENQWSKGIRPSPTYVWPRARGQFIALCEGDDYWIDPLKLQKQVDFLEENPDYGLVHTDTIVYIQKEKKILERKKTNIPTGYVFKEILKRNYISTLTTCFRKSILLRTKEENKINRKFLVGDWPLWIEMSRLCKFHYLNEVTGCYRYINNSITHKGFLNQLKTYSSYYYVIRHFFNKYSKSLSLYYKFERYFNLFLLLIKMTLLHFFYFINIRKRKW